MKILVTPSSFSKESKSIAKELLESKADEIVYNPYGRPMTAEEIIPLLQGVDGYVAGLDYITAEVIEKAPDSLKVISRYGVGFDRVDTAAATKKGIIVTNTPGMNSQSVADLAFGLMLAVARGIPTLNAKVKHGEWPRASGVELYKKTLGVVGFGGIGKGVAMRGKGFSMNVLAYDPYFDRDYAQANGIEEATLEKLMENSDVISLHVPLNEETKNMINGKTIEKMKQGVILINTSRGGLIDEQAAYEALKSGKFGGLGLDAFEKEPPDASPLFELDNVVATPHAGAHTRDAVNNMGILAVQNLLDVLSGKICRFIVNKP
jgi:D-3-phosphoglycerate dehydrogenase